MVLITRRCLITRQFLLTRLVRQVREYLLRRGRPFRLFLLRQGWLGRERLVAGRAAPAWSLQPDAALVALPHHVDVLQTHHVAIGGNGGDGAALHRPGPHIIVERVGDHVLVRRAPRQTGPATADQRRP